MAAVEPSRDSLRRLEAEGLITKFSTFKSPAFYYIPAIFTIADGDLS